MCKCKFSYFSTKTYAVGTQKNRLNETGFFEHPQHMFKLIGKKITTNLSSKICFTEPMLGQLSSRTRCLNVCLKSS